MTKEHLLDALLAIGVKAKRSEKKEFLIQEARRRPGLLRSIFEKHLREFRVVKPEWESALEKWAMRCQALHPIALVILNSVAIQSSRNTIRSRLMNGLISR